MFQTKQKDKNAGKNQLNKMEIHNFPDKEFKVKVTKLLTKLGRRMDDTVRT